MSSMTSRRVTGRIAEAAPWPRMSGASDRQPSGSAATTPSQLRAVLVKPWRSTTAGGICSIMPTEADREATDDRGLVGGAGRSGGRTAALGVTGLDDLQIADRDRNRRDQVTVQRTELPRHREPRVRLPDIGPRRAALGQDVDPRRLDAVDVLDIRTIGRQRRH